MRIGLPFLAVVAVAAIALRLYFDQKDGLSFWSQSTAPTRQKTVGQVHQTDPMEGVDDASGPLSSPSADPITEAAYHQQAAVTMTDAFGADENTDGEEVVNLQ